MRRFLGLNGAGVWRTLIVLARVGASGQSGAKVDEAKVLTQKPH